MSLQPLLYRSLIQSGFISSRASSDPDHPIRRPPLFSDDHWLSPQHEFQGSPLLQRPHTHFSPGGEEPWLEPRVSWLQVWVETLNWIEQERTAAWPGLEPRCFGKAFGPKKNRVNPKQQCILASNSLQNLADQKGWWPNVRINPHSW